MADIRPFRALYYDTGTVGDVGKVIAPPYDVIDEEQQRQLLSSHPCNIVRLILPEGPVESGIWQEKAASTYSGWKKQGVFRDDPRAALYLYRQMFTLADGRHFDRLALIALYRLEEPGQGGIYPHERTFPQVTREQLHLLRCCRANFSQVFALFRDDEEYRALLNEKAVSDGRKLLEFRFPASIGNQLIALEDPGMQREIASLIGEGGVFIADGHHRYETALAFREECRRDAEYEPEELPCDFISMAFVGINDPGLVLLPVHRLLSGTGRDTSMMLKSLASDGHLEEVRRGDWEESVRSVHEHVVGNREEEPLFGVVTPGQAHLFRPSGAEALKSEEAGAEENMPLLDVTVLHKLIIQRILGLQETGDDSAEGLSIRYTVDLHEVMEAIGSGRADIAFLQRSPTVMQAWNLASHGMKMPHKSTYFYPKMPSGLVIYDHRSSLSAYL